jgi:biotin operon repressor
MEKFPHIQVPYSILEKYMTGEISKEEFITWIAVKSFDWTDKGRGNGCTASQSTIAKVAGISRKNVNPHLQGLVKKGFLQKESHGKGKTNTYRCVIPEPEGIHPAFKQTGQVGVPQTGQVGVPQTGQVGVPQTGQVGVPQTGQVGVPQTGHKVYKDKAYQDNHINPTNTQTELYQKDDLYGEYELVKGSCGWLVNDDQSIFHLFKKFIEQTAPRNCWTIKELWDTYCNELEANGITDFNGYLGKFLGKDIYYMVEAPNLDLKPTKDRNKELPIVLRLQEEKRTELIDEEFEKQKELIRKKLLDMNEKHTEKITC